MVSPASLARPFFDEIYGDARPDPNRKAPNSAMSFLETSETETPSIETARVVDGGRMILRGLQRLCGVALVLAAMGLWIAPGASWDSEIVLFKLVLSVMAGLAGGGLIGASVRPPAPEVEIDVARREVRLVRRAQGAPRVVLQCCAFDALSRVERSGPVLKLWDRGGRFLAEVNLSDHLSRNRFVMGLRDAGKLA